MARSGSIIGDRQYHLSVPYLRSQRTGVQRHRRPSAQQLRAGMALGHPRPGGRSDDRARPAPPRPADPGTQTGLFDEEKG
jgi:hypothetical protein